MVNANSATQTPLRRSVPALHAIILITLASLLTAGGDIVQPQAVPDNWDLNPRGVKSGDSFRLLFNAIGIPDCNQSMRDSATVRWAMENGYSTSKIPSYRPRQT